MSPDDGKPFDGAQAFARMWTEFASEMAHSGAAFSPESVTPEASRAFRQSIFRAMSEMWEDYLRSPEFLQTMRQSMNSAIEFRRQCNAMMNQTIHDFQGVSSEDVDQLMLVARRLEQRTVDTLERISEQIEGLEERLSQLEAGGSPRARSPRRKPAKSTGAARKTAGSARPKPKRTAAAKTKPKSKPAAKPAAKSAAKSTKRGSRRS